FGAFFFFSSRRRHTRFSRDWSSDVCSSDLTLRALVGSLQERVQHRGHEVCDRDAFALDDLAQIGWVLVSSRARHDQPRAEQQRRSEERRVGKEGRYGGTEER